MTAMAIPSEGGPLLLSGSVDGLPESEWKRPLKFGLRSRDILFFMHIPKTAGTTLFSLLESRFRAQEILSLKGPRLHEALMSTAPADFNTYRLIRAHYDYSIYRYLPRKPVYVTMFRSPMERVISAYVAFVQNPNHWLSQKLSTKDLSLLEFVERPEAKAFVNNRQVRQLVGAVKRDALGLSDQAMLEVAKARLDEFAFFGLLDRFDESIDLLRYTFGWPSFRGIEPLNVTDREGIALAFDSDTRDRIEELNYLDQQLYLTADQIFEIRMRKMMLELRDADHKGHDYPRGRIWLKLGPPLVLNLRGGRGPRFVARVGRVRRRIIPENSLLESVYVRIRRRLAGW